MPATLKFTCCGECGAIISVRSLTDGTLDNSREHAKWHADLKDKLEKLRNGQDPRLFNPQGRY